MSTLLLEIVHLDVTFGSIAAVRDLSFSIATGQVLGLVGESGSGKSVTSLAIMRLLPPQAFASGEIHFNGVGRQNLLTLESESIRQLCGSENTIIFQELLRALKPVV